MFLIILFKRYSSILLALTVLLTILGLSFGFAQSNGTLIVEVTGLPSEKEAEVWVISKESRQKFTLRPSIDGAAAIQLSPNTYIITALNVPAEGASYMVSDLQPNNVLEVSADETTTVSIEYVQAAVLIIEVNNLPDGVLSKLYVVNGSSGEKLSVCNLVNSPSILTLLPSSYAVAAFNVGVKGNTYKAEKLVSSVNLNNGESATISINYNNMGETKEGDLEGISSDC